MIIDRFEGAYAICELPDKTFVQVNRKLIDDSAIEGDILQQARNKFVVDHSATDSKKAEILQKTARLFNRRQ